MHWILPTPSTYLHTSINKDVSEEYKQVIILSSGWAVNISHSAEFLVSNYFQDSKYLSASRYWSFLVHLKPKYNTYITFLIKCVKITPLFMIFFHRQKSGHSL